MNEPKSEDEIDNKDNVKIGSFSGILKVETIKTEVQTDLDNMSVKREIEIELLDVSNEEKYEKLVTEEKIKSTFKRRLSNSSSGEYNMKSDTEHNDHSKKSKLNNPKTVLPYNLHERYVETYMCTYF